MQLLKIPYRLPQSGSEKGEFQDVCLLHGIWKSCRPLTWSCYLIRKAIPGIPAFLFFVMMILPQCNDQNSRWLFMLLISWNAECCRKYRHRCRVPERSPIIRRMTMWMHSVELLFWKSCFQVPDWIRRSHSFPFMSIIPADPCWESLWYIRVKIPIRRVVLGQVAKMVRKKELSFWSNN